MSGGFGGSPPRAARDLNAGHSQLNLTRYYEANFLMQSICSFFLAGSGRLTLLEASRLGIAKLANAPVSCKLLELDARKTYAYLCNMYRERFHPRFAHTPQEAVSRSATLVLKNEYGVAVLQLRTPGAREKIIISFFALCRGPNKCSPVAKHGGDKLCADRGGKGLAKHRRFLLTAL